MKISTPTRKTREIPACPQSGEGVHGWLMSAGWALRLNGEDAATAGRYLSEHITRRPDPRNEIEQVISKVFDTSLVIGSTPASWPPSPQKWPEPSRDAIESVTASRRGLVDLWESSPVRMDEDFDTSGDVLTALFPGDPLLCIGNKTDFFTAHLSDFANSAHAFEQIVPSPMLAKYGKTQTGRTSQHTLDATGPRRFLIIEGDKIDGTPIPKDAQAAVLLHLAQSAPLALVVDSGHRSLHGWFYVAGKTDEQLTPFFRRACSLGADRALWTRSQFARMPEGTRNNGNRQTIYFFNPAVIKK